MDLFLVPHTAQFKLYIATKPSGGEKLLEDIQKLKLQSDKVLVCSLLTKKEINKYQLQSEEQICVSNGIDFFSLEIIDESIPTYINFKQFIEKLQDKQKLNYTIVIHCKHGIGRSGMIAVALLLNIGYELEDACKLVSKARGYTVPQSKSQFKLLSYYFANDVKG